MSEDTTAVADVEAEATTEDGKKKRKRKSGPRKRTAFGREGLVLKPYDIPEAGFPPETDIDDFDPHKHTLLQHPQFQDPLDYHKWLRDRLAPQLVQIAQAGIDRMEKIGDAKARQSVNAVNGSIEATGAMIQELGADTSKEAKEAILKDLAEMMAKVQASMTG